MPTTKKLLVKTLVECGATTAFTLPGLGITWTLDEFYEARDKIRLVLTRSEQIASIMAQVTGRLTGRPGVLLGQGPWISTTGAFGILEAYFAGSPMVVLTDTSCYDGYAQHGVYQTMTGDYGAADIRAVLGSMTKYVTYATEPREAIYGLQLAFKHAVLPRRGPAAVIMKSNIIRQEIAGDVKPALYPAAGHLKYTPAQPDKSAVERSATHIARAKQPVIIAGNGIDTPPSRKLLAKVAENSGIAVVTSYNGKGVVNETADYCCGMLGTWGNRTANKMLSQADCILVLGASLAPDYMRFLDPTMVRPGEQTIIQVDIDPRNAGWVYPVDEAITGNVEDVLRLLSELNLGAAHRSARLEVVGRIKDETGYNKPQMVPSAPGSLHLSDIVETLNQFLSADDLLCLDAGSNRIWATSQLRVRSPGQLLVPGGIGGMGWGAPAAAAAKLVYPKQRVTCLTGDGGFGMTMSVMMTCVQEQLPIVVVVANNCGLGMVRDNLGDRKIAVDFTKVDFATIAEGMGCQGMRIDHPENLRDAIEQAHRSGLPTVIDVAVDPSASHRSVSDY